MRRSPSGEIDYEVQTHFADRYATEPGAFLCFAPRHPHPSALVFKERLTRSEPFCSAILPIVMRTRNCPVLSMNEQSPIVQTAAKAATMEVKKMSETMFKVALLRAGMTQHQLALRLGLHPSTVSRIVAGMFVPPPEVQTAFRAALGEHGGGLQFGYRLKDVAVTETNKTTVVETESTCPARAAEEGK